MLDGRLDEVVLRHECFDGLGVFGLLAVGWAFVWDGVTGGLLGFRLLFFLFTFNIFSLAITSSLYNFLVQLSGVTGWFTYGYSWGECCAGCCACVLVS